MRSGHVVENPYVKPTSNLAEQTVAAESLGTFVRTDDDDHRTLDFIKSLFRGTQCALETRSRAIDTTATFR